MVEESKKEEIERSQEEFKKSLESIGENNDVLEKLYWLPKEYVKAIASDNNDIYGLILTGPAGIGKSYGVIQVLNGIGVDYVYYSGFTTPLGLYEFLYNNRESGKIIVFDDTFGILNNKTSIMLMLNALYSSSGLRKLSWNSSKLKDLPSEFILESNLILITNEIPKNIGTGLINSRCLNYHFDFSNNEIITIMKAIAELEHPKLSKEERREIVKFIIENTDEATENIDLRTQNKIEQLYLYDKDNWMELSMPLLLNKDEKLILIKKILNDSNSLKEAKNKWCAETGLSERQFQRYNRILKERS